MVDNLIISFAVFSVLGYFAEVIYCSIPERRFVNRGFLYGPYLPIYGFGSLIVTIVLDPVSQYPILVFLLSFLLTSVLEYFTSWLLEKLFSVKLWDYSKKRININGRVCLLNSTLFGLLGLFAEYAVQPLLQRGIEAVPPLLRHYAATILLVVFSVDTTLSVMKMRAFRNALARIREIRGEAEARIRALQGEGKTEIAEELRARLEESIEHYKAGIRGVARHIVLSNPTLTARSEAFERQISVIRSWAKERSDLRRKYRADMDEIDSRRRAELKKAKHD